MTIHNYESSLYPMLEEQVPQEGKVVALQAEIEPLQDDMVELKRMNQELAQRIKTQGHTNFSNNPNAHYSETNKHHQRRSTSREEIRHLRSVRVNSKICVPHRERTLDPDLEKEKLNTNILKGNNARQRCTS